MKARFTLMLLISFLGIVDNVFAQWSEIPSPFGYQLNTNLISKNGVVYTIAMKDSSANFVLTNDLNSWSNISSIATPYIDPPQLLEDNAIFYLFTKKATPSFIQYSSDGGNNWFKIPTSTVPGLIHYFVPVNNTLIVCTDKEIYQSLDNGLNWKLVKDLNSTTIIGAKKMLSGNIIVTTVDNIFISNNKGDSWDEYATPYPSTLDYQILKIYSNSAGLFIGTILNSQSAFYRSEDEGKSWATIKSPNNGQYYYIDELKVNNDKWWVISGGLFSTTDQGQNWDTIHVPSLNQFEISGDTLYSGGNYGFFKSYTAGKTWLSGNLGWKSVDASLEYPNNFYPNGYSFNYYNGALYFSSYNGVYSTKNEGKEWLVHDTGDLFFGNPDFVSSGNIIGFFGIDAYSSTDKGNTWNKINPAFAAPGPIGNGSRFTALDKYIFGISWTDHNMFRSEDGGLNWTELPETFSFVMDVKAANNRLFVPEYDGLVVSEDYGITYKPAGQGLTDDTDISNMWVSGPDIFIISKDKLYTYLPNNSWVAIGTGMKATNGKPAPIEKISGLSNFKIANCNYEENGKQMHLYTSEDWGSNWKEQSTFGVPDLESDLCTASESAIYLAGINATDVFEGSLQIFKLDIVNAVRDPLTINQINIFPNPSEGIFSIKGDFINTNNNFWRIYNSFGLEVANGQGGPEINIDKSTLPNGYYIIYIENENGKVSRSLIIMH